MKTLTTDLVDHEIDRYSKRMLEVVEAVVNAGPDYGIGDAALARAVGQSRRGTNIVIGQAAPGPESAFRLRWDWTDNVWWFSPVECPMVSAALAARAARERARVAAA